jgi:hypothetical protein
MTDEYKINQPDPVQIVKDIVKETFEKDNYVQKIQKQIEENKAQEEEKQRIDALMKEEQKRKDALESQKEAISTFHKSLSEKMPVDKIMRLLGNNTELSNSVAVFEALDTLSEDYTGEEIATLFKKFTEDDFDAFKANDNSAKITKKLDKTFSKYKTPQSKLPDPIHIASTPSNIEYQEQNSVINGEGMVNDSETKKIFAKILQSK